MTWPIPHVDRVLLRDCRRDRGGSVASLGVVGESRRPSLGDAVKVLLVGVER